VEDKNDKAKIEFGIQLKKYRINAGISQGQLAQAIEKNQSYIVSIEKGDRSLGIDYMETLSAYFGVKYYDLANPKFPVPSKSELRKNIRQYCVVNHIDPSHQDEKISPNYARNMDIYLASNLLAEPKTSYQISVDYVEMFDETIRPSKVTDILNRAPRNELVDIIKSDRGKVNVYKLRKKKNL